MLKSPRASSCIVAYVMRSSDGANAVHVTAQESIIDCTSIVQRGAVTLLGVGGSAVVVGLAPAEPGVPRLAWRLPLQAGTPRHQPCRSCRSALGRWIPHYSAPVGVITSRSALQQLRALLPSVPWPALDEIANAKHDSDVQFAGALMLDVSHPSPHAAPALRMNGWWSFELKPKWSSRPQIHRVTSAHVDLTVHPVKLQHERFALMQAYKARKAVLKGKMFATSRYSPEQLFTGQFVLIRESLQALRESPQNNLRVRYVDGEAEHSRVVDLTLVPAEVLDSVATLLAMDDVLQTVRRLQEYGRHGITDSGGLPVVDVELLQGLMVSGEASLAFHYTDGSVVTREWTPTLAEECLDAFYVSTTAKDASIVVQLSAMGCGPSATWAPVLDTHHTTPAAGSQWIASDEGGALHGSGALFVLDLDSKKHKPLQWYHDRDQAILSAFLDQQKVL
jgi:hypothetical protein